MKARRLPYMNRRDQKRFWARVDKNGPVPAHRPELGRCWLWLLKNGKPCKSYGDFRYAGKVFRAARVAWTLANGAWPWSPISTHLCSNPPCVNPAHLEAISNQENILQGNREREKTRGPLAPALALDEMRGFGANKPGGLY